MAIVSLSLPNNAWTMAYEVTCEKCGNHDQAVSHGTGGRLMPFESALKVFRRFGWEIRGKRTICPDCLTPLQRQARATAAAVVSLVSPPQKLIEPPTPVSDEIPTETIIETPTEEPTVAEPQRLPLPELDRAAKRRIHDAVAGNWDERAGRYIGAASDQSIADELKVPRAWIAEIRADFFGDDGTNEEVGLLRRDLDVAVIRFDTAADEALRLASAMEKQATEVKALRARLERVEKSLLPRR
jgi:hypothetical protein